MNIKSSPDNTDIDPMTHITNIRPGDRPKTGNTVKVATGTPSIHVRLSPAQPTSVYDTYWKFAAERQAIFFRRFHGESPPWTDDSILRQYKFTNAYRASDRVSQYLIRNVIGQETVQTSDIFFRVILFKLFNKIDTWELISRSFDEIGCASYRYDEYDSVLTQVIDRGTPIYSAAYIMPSGGPGMRETRKHRMHLKLLDRMVRERLPERIADCRRMRDAFELVRSYPSIGDFLAYQYVTDLNYSSLTDFSESEFVIPGPGAIDGIQKCFSNLGGLTPGDLIRFVCDRQEQEFDRLGLRFQDLWGRPLQYIDCQNLFCEVGKYARVFHPELIGKNGRTRIKQHFRANQSRYPLEFPAKWGINERLVQSEAALRGSVTNMPSRNDDLNLRNG